MVRTLPTWIELRRNGTSGAWFMICKVCGVKEGYDGLWPASRAAWDHVDMELAELDEKRAGG